MLSGAIFHYMLSSFHDIDGHINNLQCTQCTFYACDFEKAIAKLDIDSR